MSTRNSPRAPAESPVERRAVRETGSVSDRVHTREPPQRTQPKTDAGGTRQGQSHREAPNRYDAEQAQSPCLGRGQQRAQRARFPASLHVPRAAAQYIRGASPRDGKRHHGVGKANRSTKSDRTGQGAAHQRRATRHAIEARRRPKPRHTNRCQATTATGCRKPEQRAQHATNTGTGARQHQTHTPMPHTPARSHTNTQTPRSPSQEWRGAAKIRAQTHTHAPHTPARSGGVQAKRAHEHTHKQTPQPGVAGRSRNQALAHTSTPNTPARSGGVQAERAQEHTHTRTPQPGVAGRS